MLSAQAVFYRLFTYIFTLSLLLIALLGCNEKTLIEPTAYRSLRGRVLNVTTQQAVPNALVSLSPSSRVVSTNAVGEFQFDSLTLGTYTLQAIRTGFTSQSATVTVTDDPIPQVSLLLTAATSTNLPPSTPTLRSPAINSTPASTSVTLKWRAIDPNQDSLTYDVLFYKSGTATPLLSYTGLRADSLVVPGLEYSTTYLWQVIARDRQTATNSPVWTFTTPALPDFNYVFARLVNGQYQIFASNGSTGGVQLTRTGSNWRPIASPNQQQIAYLSTAANDLQLFIMNADGSNQRQVTTVPVNGLIHTDLSFCWSPDGTQLLYPSNNRLYVIQTNGAGLRQVAQAPSGRFFAGCDWTAQGNEIVARTTGSSIYDSELMLLRPDGSEARSVFMRPNRRVGNPVFSIDGRQLAFSADSGSVTNDQGRQLDARLLLLNLSTGRLTDLSSPVSSTVAGSPVLPTKSPGTNDLDPRFSPSGAQLIFTNSVNTLTSERTVYAIDLTTPGPTNRRALISNADMPYWRRQ